MADELVRKTISLPAELYPEAEKAAKRRGFQHSFSAYVAWLIERDQQGGVEREQLEPTNPKPKQ